MKSALCLYTAQYPYGLGEQFIETEIHYLAAHFDQVIIFPAIGGETIRSVPQNVKVVLLESETRYTTFKGFTSLGLWVLSCMRDIWRQQDKIMALSTLLRLGYSAKEIYDYHSSNKLVNAKHYTYWFDDWSTSLSILSAKKQIKGYISRTHRFDLYHNQHIDGYIPFRSFQLKHVNKLVFIAQDGKKYMEEQHPEYREKYHISYLGVENNKSFKSEINKDVPYLIVSCSRLVQFKRVDMIVKALSKITNVSIKWIHFGGGELFEPIKKLANDLLPDNVKWEFKGMVPNTEVLAFYQNNIVDLFINLSSSEGLPVSIMEVISYGVPVVATDVGGTSEIINPQTGILLNENPTTEETKLAILALLNEYSRSTEKRKKIYDYWNNNFNAKINYQERFVPLLID